VNFYNPTTADAITGPVWTSGSSPEVRSTTRGPGGTGQRPPRHITEGRGARACDTGTHD
jgi:hypothetical protein